MPKAGLTPIKHERKNMTHLTKPQAVNKALLCAAIGFAMGTAHADASRLGTELTPAGAEKGANKEGSIPAWSGNEAQQSGWAYGKLRAEHFKHKADKSTLTIDASNADKYADKLSPGQLAMLKQIKGYRMDVYPTRRTCGLPDANGHPSGRPNAMRLSGASRQAPRSRRDAAPTRAVRVPMEFGGSRCRKN